MKKYIISLLIIFSTFSAFANKAQLFTYDKAKVEAELSDLTQMQMLVESNPDISVNEVITIMNNGITPENYIIVFGTDNTCSPQDGGCATAFLIGFAGGALSLTCVPLSCLFGAAGVFLPATFHEDLAPSGVGCLIGMLTYYTFATMVFNQPVSMP